jgi:hypothetical protein
MIESSPLGRFRIAIVGLILLQTISVGVTGWMTSPVLDELPHLVSGIAHWTTGTFDLYRVNPPLVRMIAAAPLVATGCEADWQGGWPVDAYSRPEFGLGRQFAQDQGKDVFRTFALARWSCLPFLWLGCWTCYRWARELYGAPAGVAALAAWCVCPNVQAWGATICPDMPAAATGLWAGYTFWSWLKEPTGPNLLWAILAMGIALLTKSTWIVLPGLWPLVWVCWRWSLRFVPSQQSSQGRPTQFMPPPLAGLVCLLFGALYAVNLGYAFAGSMRPLGEFEFVSRALGGDPAAQTPGNRFRDTWLGGCPSPLPADYLRGIDVQRYDFEQGKWSYLRGEQKRGGWWYYYLYALGVKTPLGTLIWLGLAIVTAGLASTGASRRDEVVLLAPAVVVLLLVSSQTGFNRHLRYALPALPFVFVWMSRLTTIPRRSGGRGGRIAVAGCLVMSALGVARVWPHTMAYFHELAGGPEEGHRHLLDANIDWGQGLLAVRRWLDAHPEARPVFLRDFGWVSPQQAGIVATPIPALEFDRQGGVIEGRLEDVVPGWYIVSVNHLMGYRHYEVSQPVFTWLQEFTPVARPGYANWVFHLTEADVQVFRERHAGGKKTDPGGHKPPG